MRTLISICFVIVAVAACSGAPPASPLATDSGSLPNVAIDSPASGTTVTVGQVLQVSVSGDDARGISRLDLRVGDVLVDSASTPNAAAEPTFNAVLEWTPSAEGVVTISALAYRPTGTGSLPASIQVTVVPVTGAASPGPTFFPGATPTGTLGQSPAPTSATEPTAAPTRAPRPTAPPPPPTKAPPPPTAPPTAPPVVANLTVVIRDGDPIPNPWYAGQDTFVTVYIRNRDDKPSPRFVLRGRIGGGDLVRLPVEEGAIGADGVEHFTLVLVAPQPGNRTLRLEARLPQGYADVSPDDNILTIEVPVTASEEPPAASATP